MLSLVYRALLARGFVPATENFRICAEDITASSSSVAVVKPPRINQKQVSPLKRKHVQRLVSIAREGEKATAFAFDGSIDVNAVSVETFKDPDATAVVVAQLDTT